MGDSGQWAQHGLDTGSTVAMTTQGSYFSLFYIAKILLSQL